MSIVVKIGVFFMNIIFAIMKLLPVQKKITYILNQKFGNMMKIMTIGKKYKCRFKHKYFYIQSEQMPFMTQMNNMFIKGF